MMKFASIEELFRKLSPSYHGSSHTLLLMKFKWDSKIVKFLERIGPRRARNRVSTYIIPGELERAAEMNAKRPSSGGSIRFGHMKKKGQGYLGERGDFCLIGGHYRQKNLTLFYRRLELLGGLYYDLVVIREIERKMGPINKVTIFAVQANVYARRGGSNEKFFYSLKRYFDEIQPASLPITRKRKIPSVTRTRHVSA